ncbi:PAN domain-containing protein [Roseibium aggregatum]|uniref:PAN domain-containing protein n=1 Tax=Roseibium aggregatum TaxID=187304 RepID=UPI0025AC3F90|nr:PAN domain-containing protein [Roseibium aggregatum]WJS04453.1 PAN domain-containing protein [Roseibium aggregatum]
MISRCLVFILFCLAATVAKAADVFPSNAEGCDYHLRGQIVSGDAEKLKVLPINSQGITLCLDSPGGSFAEGKRLFDTIWDQDIATMVRSGERCESACSLAFLGGSMRIGTAVIRFQMRSLRPGGKLGFHSPSLNLPNENSYPASEVQTAFAIALKAAESFFDIKLSEEHDVEAMTDFLYQRILGTRPENMFHIESIGDAVLANITVTGLTPPASITEREIANICDNAYAANLMDGRPGYTTSSQYYDEILIGDPDGDRKVVLTRQGEDLIGKVFNYDTPSKFSALGCSVRISDDWKRFWDTDYSPLSVRFEQYSVGDYFGDGEAEEVSAPYWYLLPASLKLDQQAERNVAEQNASAPASAPAASGEGGFVRLSGYDLYGGDLPDGVLRNMSAEDCISSCSARSGCDAVTHDRWNRICIQKSVGVSNGRLYLLSKADTYVQRAAAGSLKPNLSVPVQTFTKQNKGFPGQPDESLQAGSAGQCETLCTERTCLGFNWSAGSGRCDLFARPGVYSDAEGIVAGFMVQPAQ